MRRLKLIDRIALLATLSLCLLSLIFIRSATLGDPYGGRLWIKQAVWILVGFCLYLFFSQFDYRKLMERAALAYLIGLVCLVLVLIWGHQVHGARSWFRFPWFSIQPSEFVKVLTVLILAKFYAKYEANQSHLIDFLVSGILVGLPVVLIILQPDLGTALVYLPLLLLPNFMLGNKVGLWITVASLVLSGILVLGVIFRPDWVFFLRDYQKERIVAYVFPGEDTTNTGYQVYQSKISIGQGGFYGLGLGQSKQAKMGFLPEKQTDFILAVVGEETGFIGILTVFALFGLLYMRGILAAMEAGDATGTLLAAMVVGTLAFQTLFNAAMLIGLMPTTGIPCPLMSYGGSSMVTSLALLGLVQSVRTHRFVYH